MRGLLIYDREGYQRNEWFIKRLTEAAWERGCELSLVVCDKDSELHFSTPTDFAIVRTINPRINEALEQLGVPTYNNSLTSLVANDKWSTYLLAREIGIEVMNTAILTPSFDFDAFAYPAVIKVTDGHGGSEVFLVNNPDECKEKFSLLAEKQLIIQSLCDEIGVDMRVYVMGDEIVSAVKRVSKTDFRSNFTLGGSASVEAPTDSMVEVVEKLRGALKFDFVGVDFIRNDGRWVLNEIEDVVGTRMLYSLTDIDAADEYMEYIINKVRRRLTS